MGTCVWNHYNFEPLHCRTAAVRVVDSVALRSSGGDAVAGMLAAFQKVLDGSAEGKPRNASERLGMVAAIQALASTRAADLAATAATAAEFLSAYYK